MPIIRRRTLELIEVPKMLKTHLPHLENVSLRFVNICFFRVYKTIDNKFKIVIIE